MSTRVPFQARLRRWLRPPRTLRPTREGWWYLALVMAVGVAATNTGNNLLYLVLSMMLAGIVVSGLLSEQTLRGIAVRREMVGPLFAGQPAFGRLLVSNCKRRLPSFSLRLREVAPTGTSRLLAYLPHLAPGAEREIGYQTRFERRGFARLPRIQTTTAFPFGLFVKATQPEAGEEVLVLPKIDPLPVDLLRALGEAGVAVWPVRGPGPELHDLRPFRVGDDTRLIHWKQSAKLDRQMVKELELEEGGRVTLIIEDPARPPREPGEIDRLEEDIRFVASLAAHLLRTDAEVELLHHHSDRPVYRGETELLHFLEYLARYAPPESEVMVPPVGATGVGLDEATTITVWLGRGLALVPGPHGEGGRLLRIAAGAQDLPR